MLSRISARQAAILLTTAALVGATAFAAEELNMLRAVVDGVEQVTGATRKTAVWRFPPSANKEIAACWEGDALTRWPTETALVTRSVRETWETVAAIKFKWSATSCKNGDPGIHILVDPSDLPHTNGLGRKLNGITHGLTLNFATLTTVARCPELEEGDAEALRTLCIRAVAVHEFGHVLALNHEQNRAVNDATRAQGHTEDCFSERSGSTPDKDLTPWDPQSVMNYCNAVANNAGVLSRLDIISIQKLYCGPDNPHCLDSESALLWETDQ
jgi:hypothetical protein